ncbi:CbtB domain-containing protein [Afifella sp. IM 167]|uniref:CbtB domain-containing protein n=1 Tax=Afifella sp. IM 167 TaxID=2033586 RepID=UPI001CCF39D8|nr:CbtB domain-containing protein [Afifella sp. IM 167]MBZ8132585.1 cobalt transporter subunit CbtB [Afifella sp. IM 167]
MNNTQTLRRTEAAAAARSAMMPALAALLVGALIVGTAGFAWSSVLHNSTHDTRHAFALPCH